jgi:hypothetical protein
VNLPHLAQRLFNTPLALHPSKAEVIMASVMDRFGITKIESSLAMDDDWYSFDDNRGRESRNDPGYENVLGIAVIPISGTLVQKLGSLRPYSGMTGYDGIRQAFLTAMEDQDVSVSAWILTRPVVRSRVVSTWLMLFTAREGKSLFMPF